MANADGRLWNVDRWTIYTLQRRFPNQKFPQGSYKHGWGDYVNLSPAQRRRCKKKMRKNNDYSIGIS